MVLMIPTVVLGGTLLHLYCQFNYINRNFYAYSMDLRSVGKKLDL